MTNRPVRLAAFLALLAAASACHKLDPHTAPLPTNEAASNDAASAPAEGTEAGGNATVEPSSAGGGLEEMRIRLSPSPSEHAYATEPDLFADELLIIEAEAEEPPAPLMIGTPSIPKVQASRGLPGHYRKMAYPDPSPSDPQPRPPAQPEPGLRARDLEGRELGAFPLRRTSVAAEISGPLGRTRVRQEYGNPYGEVIEAVYVFPLPAMAAVTDFVLEAGGRRIVGLVRPREEAERIYRLARARGQTASLLTQERPNLFTQSVANVEPGGEVSVELTFFERLAYEDGFFEWVFPMVVGPRYVPGTPVPAANREEEPAAEGADEEAAGGAPAGGVELPTDRVPDGHRITPPVLAPGEASGHRIDLTVTVEAPVSIRRLEVPSHRVEVVRDGPARRIVRLADGDRVPDRDFVLRFRLAGDNTELGVLAHRQGDEGYFLLDVQPPLEPADEQVMPREITFILDVSGSMSGLPLDLAREVVDRSLARLRPDDRFNLFFFASGNGQLWPEARPGTRENLFEARRFLETLEGSGGTEMLAGVARALRGGHDPGALQMFVFLTDGYVGDEEDILRLIREERGDARFFAFGIGGSVNRFLIEGVGEHGGGGSEVVLPRPGEVERAARRLLAAIDSPVLVDLELDWGGLPVEEVYPRRLPDLYAGASLELVGRYRPAGGEGGHAAAGHAEGARNGAPLRATAVLSGRLGARRVSYEVEVVLPAAEKAHAVLAPVWARHKIHDLSGRLLTAGEAERPELVAAITDLALEHRLASAYTAFVAVDESRVVGDGRPLRVLQPVELPQGVSYEGIFGEAAAAGGAMGVEAWGMVLQQAAGGGIGVVHLAEQGEASRSGVRAGARLLAVDRVLVRDLGHLQSLLLQAGSRTVDVRLDPGGEVRLTAP